VVKKLPKGNPVAVPAEHPENTRAKPRPRPDTTEQGPRRGPQRAKPTGKSAVLVVKPTGRTAEKRPHSMSPESRLASSKKTSCQGKNTTTERSEDDTDGSDSEFVEGSL
jgi:hypothetical protein